MILSAHQPCYMPWPGYFAKMIDSEKWCVYDVCPLEDSGYENRVQIKTKQGVQWLTVPVRRKRGQPISDVEVCHDQPWRRKHARAIELAYSEAPFFAQHWPSLKSMIYDHDWHHLSELNVATVAWLLDAMGVKPPPMYVASQLELQSTKSAAVLDMCLKLNADGYIFGVNGRDYADGDAFKRNGVTPAFQRYTCVPYYQRDDTFTPGLSTLDMLFNLGPATVDHIMRGHRTEPW